MIYVINIGPWKNVLPNPDWFPGTGFFGEKFSSLDELIAILEKFAKYTDKETGKRRYYSKIKFTFNLGSTVDAMKNRGNQQAEQNKIVDLCSIYKSDELSGLAIYWSLQGFVDPENQKVCNFAFLSKGSSEPQFIHKKFSEFLREDLMMQF